MAAQQSIRVRTPSKFRCTEANCACSCHLGRYRKSPMFLKRFLGALSFRGTCRNHAARLWEVKWWTPEWILNYNVYLLFERAACGTPSFGLRCQRKVPWGEQDTIIRFSLTGDTAGIKSILESGHGSLHDTDPNHGLTALHVSLLNPKLHLISIAPMLRIISVCHYKVSNRSLQAALERRCGHIHRRCQEHVSPPALPHLYITSMKGY